MIVLTADHGEKLPQPVQTRLRSTVRWVIDHAGPARPILEAARKPRLVSNKVRHFGITTHEYHVYDVLARAPLVMVDPDRLGSGNVISQQVRTIDTLPTVLDLLSPGLSGRYGFQGESLLPLASGNHLDLPPAVVEAHVSVRMNTALLVGISVAKWKLAFAGDNPALPWELYDLSTDPEEKRNVAKECPRVAEDLHGQALRISQESERLHQRPGSLSPEEKASVAERLRSLGYQD